MSKSLKDIPLKDVMSKPVRSVNVNALFSQVAEAFLNNEIRHLPITGPGKELVGLFSKRDLYRTVAPRRGSEGIQVFHDKVVEPSGDYYLKESLDRFILKNVMVKKVRTLTEDDTLGEAIHLMVEHKIGCVPIVDEDRKIKGIVTRYDILRLIDKLKF